ncbi:Retrotransposon gag protein [Rhizoctonia solani]|uniref:Retrotransposon gag protein n=1 Tax=Rhizoctonia solani TaxID=456999 RepID=A0A8H7I4G1_9AGAM|nr:Retrotransposon gag protein [Rhizoctonia solani]
MLANPTCQHIPWQPIPSHPLKPAPLSIKGTWDPSFCQPLLQVKRLEWEIMEIKEAGVETQTNIKNISQTINVVKDGLKSLQPHGPRTPEDTKPLVVEATPRPLSKANPVGLTSQVSFWPKSSRGLPAFAQPTPVQAVPLQVPSSPPSLHLQSPIGHPAPPPLAPVATYPAPVKVDHPDAYTGKVGSKAKQWLTRILAWTRLDSQMFPTDQEVLSFLLMNMKDSVGAWAHPHLDQLGSHQAIIQTVEGFKLEFLAAFGNPDATRAAKQKITTLTQSGTCTDYITKFRTLAMELDWNDAALRGQFAHGLHWEVSCQIATCKHRPCTLLELQNAALIIDNALREERTSHPPRIISLASNPTLQGGQRNKTAATLLVPVSNAEKWATSLRNAALAGRDPNQGAKKEAAKIGKESGPTLGKD